MPTYDYACEKCGKQFEAFQSMRDQPFPECPKELCQLETWGKGKVKRLLGTGAGLIFKGSGFYITDYRSHNYKEGAKKEAPPAAPTGGSEKSSSSGESSGSTAPAPAPKVADPRPKKETGA